jgi:amino acid transporter
MTTDEVPDIYNASGTDKKDISASNPEDFAHRDLDTEEKHSHGESRQLPELQRRLKSRHLQMIAMGKHRKYIFFS